MTELIREFYNVIVSTIKASHYLFPISITSVLYDPLFTPAFISQHHMMDRVTDDCFYKHLLDEMYKISGIESTSQDPFNNMQYICDSSDIEENESHGDYLYYYGWMKSKDTIAILYMKPSHIMAYPSRAIFYGPEYQIEVAEDKKEINVYEVNNDIRSRCFIINEHDRREALTDFLRNTDREELTGGG